MFSRQRRDLRRSYAIWAFCLSIFAFYGPVSASSVGSVSFGSVPVAQSQVFYSPFVSRVADASNSACMVSVGTDWKEDGWARHADEVAAYLGNGSTLEQAVSKASPVDIEGLSSNTPYMAFLIDAHGTMSLRIAVGFQIETGNFSLIGGGRVLDLEASVETRGDTVLIENQRIVRQLFDAFLDEESFQVAARSRKISDREHYIGYTFNGRAVHEAIDNCTRDLSVVTPRARPTDDINFSLRTFADSDVRARLEARGMACNRSFDSEGSEVALFDGAITGFSTPLGYALINRNESGQIDQIWSGDLWKVTRQGNTYAFAMSNSIRFQSPLDRQTEKACSQFGKAQCANLVFGRDGQVKIDRCFKDFLPLVELEEGIYPSDAILLSNLATPSSIGAPRGLVAVAVPTAPTSISARRSSVPVSEVIEETPDDHTPEVDEELDSLPLVSLSSAYLYFLFAFATLLVAGYRDKHFREV